MSALCSVCRHPTWSIGHLWACGWRDTTRNTQGQESRSEQEGHLAATTAQAVVPASPAGPSAVEEINQLNIGYLGSGNHLLDLALRHAEELDHLRQRLAEAEGLLRRTLRGEFPETDIERFIEQDIERFLNDH